MDIMLFKGIFRKSDRNVCLEFTYLRIEMSDRILWAWY
jgi:hypothetical protein